MGRANAALLLALTAIGAWIPIAVEAQNARGEDSNLVYNRGQSVVPIYHGWVKNPDGTYDLHFGYLNRNWQEAVDIPVGPNNTVSNPYGPDAGQPSHFLPRNNRWQFTVRVPADFGAKEVIWTLTSYGETLTAYGVLKNGYVQDEGGLQREYYGGAPRGGNKWPTVAVQGSRQLTAKVGQPITLTAIATDDGIPRRAALEAIRGEGSTGSGSVQVTGGVGGDQTRGSARGLRFAWYLYRSPQETARMPRGTPLDSRKWVTFDPPQFKVWEDQRAGQDSPWSPGWIAPPVPEGGRYVVTATFRQPGQFVLRGLAHDGIAWGSQDVTVTVAP